MLQGLDPILGGLTQVGLGLVFCFVGHSAARVVLALWGALVGFVGGTLLYVALLRWEQAAVLAMVPWWAFAVALGLLAAWLSFAFYAMGVLVSMGAIGWGMGVFVSTNLNMPEWIALAMGLVVAAGLVMVGWTLSLPKAMLVVMTALVGAGAIINGVQVLIGQPLDLLDQAGWRADLLPHAAWTAAFAALAVAGMVLQFRQDSEDNLRDAYKRV